MAGFFKSKNSAEPPAPVVPASENWSDKVRQGLSRTRNNWGKRFSGLLGSGRIDETLYEEMETALLTADAGVDATVWLLDELRRSVKREGLAEAAQLKGALQNALVALLDPLAQPLDTTTRKPFIIMLVGVNGAGKTTSIGKLAHYYQLQGRSVLLAAGDTFRAAAREQLMAWGERNNVAVIAQAAGAQHKADPAAVIYDAVNAAKARGSDIVLADTAGRLATQPHLMEELKKVQRVIAKAEPGAPHETVLVLDANTGQNALSQVQAFDDALGLTGLIVTKLDGTAKGGVIAAIARQRQHKPLPIRFIGVGEGLDDLRPFAAGEFAEALFD